MNIKNDETPKATIHAIKSSGPDIPPNADSPTVESPPLVVLSSDRDMEIYHMGLSAAKSRIKNIIESKEAKNIDIEYSIRLALRTDFPLEYCLNFLKELHQELPR